jgi:mannosyltransferase
MSDTAVGPARFAEADRPKPHSTGRVADPLAVAVLAAAVSAAGAARPSFWFDEAATISASTRSLPDLWQLLHNIDAVHGLYYFFMHGWFAVVPATEFFSRFSSCLAVAVAAAGVVRLARQFSSRTVAVCAGVMFAILPRTTWAGIETRPYALTAAVAVWLMVLLLVAARRNTAVLWVAYGVALTISIVLNVFCVAMVLVHAGAVAVVSEDKRSVKSFAFASSVAVVAVIPFLAFCRTQIAQVRWISPPTWHTVLEVAKEQYFDDSAPFAVVAALVLTGSLISRRFWPTDGGTRDLVKIAIAWITLPTLVLLAYSLWFEPVYYPRYLSFTSPAMALLLAINITALTRSRQGVAAVVMVLALAATPNYLTVQRGPYAKEGMDYSAVADVIDAHASPGDCLILDNTADWAPGPIRPLTAARPSVYEKLIDPGRGQRAADRNRLWDAHLGIWGVADSVRKCTVLWTVSERDDTVPAHESGPGLNPGPRLWRAPAYQVPHHMGFRVVERWQFSFAQVVKSTR